MGRRARAPRRARGGMEWNGGGWVDHVAGGSRAAFGKRPLESSPAQSSRVGRLGWLAPEFGRAPSGVLTVATSVTDWSPLVPSSGPVQSAPHRASPRRRDDTHGHVQADVASGPPGGWWCACTRVSLVRVSPLACCPPPGFICVSASGGRAPGRSHAVRPEDQRSAVLLRSRSHPLGAARPR
jgi:hypothetical protein